MAIVLLWPTKALASEVNHLDQELINPNGERMFVVEYQQKYQTQFRKNDPVIFTANNYQAGVQNGTLGILTQIKATNNGEEWGMVTTDDGREVKLDKALFDSLELAYAITLHKAQGSQFETVIVALPQSRMLDRAWVYTAITRAEKNIHIIGGELIMKKAIKTLSDRYKRKTALADMIN